MDRHKGLLIGDLVQVKGSHPGVDGKEGSVIDFGLEQCPLYARQIVYYKVRFPEVVVQSREFVPAHAQKDLLFLSRDQLVHAIADFAWKLARAKTKNAIEQITFGWTQGTKQQVWQRLTQKEREAIRSIARSDRL